MNLVRHRRTPFQKVLQTVELWPEFDRAIQSYNMLDFKVEVAAGKDFGSYWGFWVRAQSFKDAWRLQVGKGAFYSWGVRVVHDLPPEHQAAIELKLSDLIVRLQALTGPFVIIDQPFR